MDKTAVIYSKLEQFIKKYYSNELIKGTLFFIGLGLLYFLFTLFIEYFLWLKPVARTLLFWCFILVELFLLVRFICFPVFKLFKFQKGLDYTEASKIIGNHFSEIGDKLTNFLQLAQDKHKSELLLASIEQKANALHPIPFTKAVDYAKNKKYIPLAAIPILFFLFFYISGNQNIISQSFTRVVNYDKQYLPPAPFQFQILNSNLQTEQNQDFLLKVKTEGKVIPENAMIFIGDESYFMEKNEQGEFQFTIPKPKSNLSFHLQANEVVSKDYQLQVVTVPSIVQLDMLLQFPSYLGKKNEWIKGTGNAIVPEGTRITWKMNTLATQQVIWKDASSLVAFSPSGNTFILSKNITQNTEYQIVNSNNKVKDFEKLNYQLSVVKDQYPTISVTQAPDSLKVSKDYVIGQVSDDYGLSRLSIIYYPKDKPNNVKRGTIPVKKDIFDRFVFSFPSNLPVEQGVSYDYYFEVFDNDAAHNYKSTKSSVFSHREATDTEKEDQLLEQQNSNINSLEKSLKTQEKQFNELDKLQKMGKEKESLDFKEQQKVNDFLERQKKQDELMKEFAEKMKDNLDKQKSDKKDEDKELLKDRLEKVEKDLEKNQKLLDELKELNDKIQKEELFDKMEKLKQQSKNQTKSLQQLVELTKKYYVEKKAEQLAEKLQKLAEKQDKLAESDKENEAKKQEEINKEFNDIQKELNELDKENKELKAPVDLPNTDDKEKSIEEDMKNASDQLQKQQKEKAKSKQKSASKKMQQMSEMMMQDMAGGEMEQMEEDASMLRQIIDNLLAYSFSQEDVMKGFKGLKRGSPAFAKNLKIQQDLRAQFKHVDDSLFALSLRNPKIAEQVTTEVGNVQYNVDKALEVLAEANVYKGVSHQQFAITSANKLAEMLSFTLNNMQMQMQMSASGKGKGKNGMPMPGSGGKGDMQLPDIIKKQEGLADKMKDGMQKGDKPSDKSGEGKEGNKGDKPNQNGQSGSGGSGSKSGKEGTKKDSEGEDGEGDAKTIMDIYKEQKQLRDALEKELNKNGLSNQGQSTLDKMKQIEKQLLNKGFNNETLQKILNLKYELLKLDKAIQQQGEDKKRQSEINKKEYNNNANALPARLQEYLNSIEILNRQTLPLQENFNQKVQQYFKGNDQL
ncbi:hypothetical protein Q361_101104 [Flavobacterium croceum DSM 17960]|uniref:Uncharacterized protein n=1 Tax=Flavobacterium croceum DSM 17960 TaxID=1121886 RepID=A0A2S4NBB9_9FLAO|nr:DUF4175 family protein [Flavobacterium croceum]POS03006.1 hypothetical protein Q361_101104 [Flavobacterium croceum DSM 17960]